MCPQNQNQNIINLYSTNNQIKNNIKTNNNLKVNKSNNPNQYQTKQNSKKIIPHFNKTYDKEDNLINTKYQKPQNQKITYRKYSKDSEDSTSNEDKEEIFQNKKTTYKSNSNDFKIKYKTELCKYYEINGYCKYGDNCAYAHGKENLRSKVTHSTYYRTKKCVQFFNNGFCPYGNRCQFAHGLKSNILNNPYDRNMSYSKTIETLSKLENVENIKVLFEKKRLPIFEEISPNYNGIKSKLFDDIKSLICEKTEFYH
jgi:hypothetical protein